MLLDMFECTTGLSESLIGAEGTDALIYEGVPGAESPEHSSRNGEALIYPLLAPNYRIKGIEELHVDRFVELPLYCELILGVQYGEEGHLQL